MIDINIESGPKHIVNTLWFKIWQLFKLVSSLPVTFAHRRMVTPFAE